MGERLSEPEMWHMEGCWVARRDQVSVQASKTPGSEPTGRRNQTVNALTY